MIDIEVGGVYRAVAPGHDEAAAALVLVTGVDEATQSVEVTLLSPDLEFGSSLDLVLTGDEIGRGYDLLVESDVFGYVWASQLDRWIGRVDAGLLAALGGLRAGGVVGRAVGGPAVVGRSDPRWEFKQQELRRLQILSADCTSALVGRR